ncbi:unnamed protein product [Caretta caretta]
MAKCDCEIYINSLVDEAEDSLKHNNLNPALTDLAGSHKQPTSIPIMRPEGSPCSSIDMVPDRSKIHYESMQMTVQSYMTWQTVQLQTQRDTLILHHSRKYEKPSKSYRMDLLLDLMVFHLSCSKVP